MLFRSPEILDIGKLKCPHDLVIESPNTLLINSSGSQELYRFHLDTKELELVYSLNDQQLQWNRGLLLKKDSVFIGTGNGTVLEVDLISRKLVKQERVIPDDIWPSSIFGII